MLPVVTVLPVMIASALVVSPASRRLSVAEPVGSANDTSDWMLPRVLDEGVPGLLPMLTILPVEAPATTFTGSGPKPMIGGSWSKPLKLDKTL